MSIIGCYTPAYNVTFTHYILDAFSSHLQVDVIYTDFTRAIDLVNHLALVKICER